MTDKEQHIFYPIFCIDGPLKDYRFQAERKIEVMDIFGTRYRILWDGGAQEFPYPYPEKFEVPEGYPKTFTAYAATHEQAVMTGDPA